jgi:hypothetical protein
MGRLASLTRFGWLFLAILIGTGFNEPPIATLSGRVVAADSMSTALPGAIVTLESDDGKLSVSSITDEDGGFSFGEIALGHYELRARKLGYLSSAYGSLNSDSAGALIGVQSDQSLSGFVIRMFRDSSIEGVVIDPWGRPADATVSAFRLIDNAAVLSASSSTLADGHYRVSGLQPGAYVLRAAIAAQAATPRRQLFDGDVDRALARLAASPQTPQVVSSSSNDSTTATIPGVFYADALTLSTAARVILRPEDQLQGFDFHLQLTHPTSVHGTVSGGSTSLHSTVTLAYSSPLSGVVPPPPSMTSAVESTGGFRFRDVQEGDYIVESHTVPAPGSSSREERAVQHLSVVNQDTPAISLNLEPTVSVVGRVMPAAGERLPNEWTVLLVPQLPELLAAINLGLVPKPEAVVGADGAFEVRSVLPGTYHLRSAGLRGRYFVDVESKGSDSSGEIRILPSPTGNFELSLQMRTDVGSASGRIDGFPAGASPTGYFVMVFPTNTSLRLHGSARVRSERVREDGSYRVENLPPGEYFLGLATSHDRASLSSFNYLEALSQSAAKLNVSPLTETTLNLRISR